MREFVALISGGKDSIFSIMECVVHGYRLEAVVNLSPTFEDSCAVELDSYMYQSVASEGIPFIAQALEVPLYQFPITGKPTCQALHYSTSIGLHDEVEDLFIALSQVIAERPTIRYVSSGAILSDYQRIRVEHVASRLSLQSLAFLWRRPTDILIREMIAASVDAVIVKIASFGLRPTQHLGAHLSVILLQLEELSRQPGALNVCGEGGEYESFTLDCPLFRRRIRIRSPPRTVLQSDDAFDPVAYVQLTDLELEDKPLVEVCKTASDLLSFVKARSTQFGVCPLLTPLERLQDLERRVLEEFSSDLQIARPPCRTHSNKCLCSKDINWSPHAAVGVRSMANGCLWITKSCVGVSHFAGDITGEIVEATHKAIRQLQNILYSANLVVDNVVHCLVFINQPLTEPVFAAFNRVYAATFGLPWEENQSNGSTDVQCSPDRLLPPTRVTAGVNCIVDSHGEVFFGSSYVGVSLTAVLYPMPPDTPAPLAGGCDGLLVRSVSHWAPANIGSYCQTLHVPLKKQPDGGDHRETAITVDEVDNVTTERISFFSGQIGLIPELMVLPAVDNVADDESDALDLQCWLALRHCHRLLMLASPSYWSDLFVAICYGTSQYALQRAREIFHRAVCSILFAAVNNGSSYCHCDSHVLWVHLSDLPKQAAVEWQIILRSNSASTTTNVSPICYATPTQVLEFFSEVSIIFCTEDCLTDLPRNACVFPVLGFLNRTERFAGLLI
ncbi:Diphthine--ammonia ligase [Paragonimus heterotremus]|uniref:Diphthine--ammonia ligase n=1 Tax=Paragonimus heterotremus TaxID=100268 RepID=A0A8J4WZV7_9TREM|nr:Diphthine--ammonia ligase [Paragonimus heterotremus]